VLRHGSPGGWPAVVTAAAGRTAVASGSGALRSGCAPTKKDSPTC